MISKKRIFSIIQIGSVGDFPSRAFDFGFITMVLLNLVIVLAETFSWSADYTALMNTVETFTVICFTVEYILRVWTSDLLYPTKNRLRALFSYIFSFTGIIDLLAFLPFYLPIFFPSGVVALRILRIVRILRLFRINAYYDAINVITDVLRSKRDQLLSSIFLLLVLIVCASLSMYSLEHEAQPDVFQNAFSGIWWAVSSLLTVGYGDIYPITFAGRCFGILITCLGVGMVAIPTGILSAGFVEQYTQIQRKNEFAADVHFLTLELDSDSHPWTGLCVSSLPLPPNTVISVIQRGDGIVIPQPDTVLTKNDTVLLCPLHTDNTPSVSFKGLLLNESHPWVGKRIRSLDISRQTYVASVQRNGNLLAPTGSLSLEIGDVILLYTQHI